MFKNKKLVIGITAIAVISIVVIISLTISNLLSDKTPTSYDPGDSNVTDNNSLSLKNLGTVDIVPLVADSTGVDLNSGFKIVCENKQPKSFFQKALYISPQQDYKINQVSDNEFHISFSDTLKPNNIYRIGLTGDKESEYRYSWAFQTKKSFALIRTMPRDRSTYVPIDSGVELSFSHEGVENIEQYFEITPKVNGRFVYHHKTAVFMPEKLEYGTIYTVTIKKGLGLKGSDEVLPEDYVFTFETRKSAEQETTEYLNFTEVLYNFTPQAAPVLDVYASQDFMNQDITVEVYKYSNENDLLEDFKQYDTLAYRAFGRSSSLKFDISKLEKITDFTTKVMNNNSNYWYGSFIVFPSNLSEGHYLINIKSKNATYQTHVQVNDMAIYAMAGTKESLVWVNSSSTGKPIEGALVSLNMGSVDGIKPIKTDKDGVAVIPNEIFKEQKKQNNQNGQNNRNVQGGLEQQGLFFKIARNEGPGFLAPLRYFTWQYSDYNYSGYESAEKYWSYLYTDRGLYLPDDTIEIWGMVRPRVGGDLPSKGTLYLHRSDYYYGTDYGYGDNEKLSEIMSEEIDISDLGTFKSSMKLSNFNPGSYFIQLKLDNEMVIQKYFEVRQYTKPAYMIDITPDKKVMFEWEKLNVDIQAGFFEGSPVSGLDLNYSYLTTWDTRKEGNLVCDENGKAALEITPVSLINSWHPLTLSLYINNAKAEEEEIYANSNVMVFPRDTMIEVNVTSKSKSGNENNKMGFIEIKTNRIDLEKPESQSNWWYNADDFRGDNTDIPLNIKIYEQHWDHEETGQYYDFINKKVVKKYRYFEVKNLRQEFKANTSEGKYSYEFPAQENENYVIEVTGTDSRQKSIVETAYLYRYAHPQDEYIDRYTIGTDDTDSTDNTDINDRKFKLGDRVALAVKKNNLKLPAIPGNRFLYMTLKNGILSYTVESEPSFSFNFTKDYIPNIYVKAVYFDGKNVFDVENRLIPYDYNEKDLIIDVKADKQEYRPGDTVEVEIEVKDAQGIPCSAEVNLSVVDEAFFAIWDQYVNTLASLYQYCFHTGIITQYLSYKPLNINFGAPEMGGEGGDQSVRFMFKDNAFFDTIKTDKNGKGKASFKLPDNLTSWRITYQGVAYQKANDDLKAGSGKINIPVKLPFFVDIIFNNIFMDGDTVCISARSFGTEIDRNEKVEYTVLLEKNDDNNDIKKTFKSEGKGNDLTNIDLGKLEEGNYSVTVKAEQGNYSDGIKRDFKVVKSMLETAKLESYKLTDSLDLLGISKSSDSQKSAGRRSLTTLSFCNEEISTHYNSLLSLMHTWGERVDQKLSRKISDELMKKYYGEDMWWAADLEDFELNPYQLYDGGIALLSYDSSNPEVTAKIASLSKDLPANGLLSLFDNTAMKWYFYKTLDNIQVTSEDAAASLWGLAALNEPVLIDIMNLLQSDDVNIGIKEKLYLGIGLAELGSLDEAQKIYDDIIKQYSVSNSPYVYIDSKTTRDDTIELTSLCSVLAIRINAPEKAGMFKYMQDNSTETILSNIEKLIYLINIAPDTNQKGSFTVEVNGRKENVSLEKNKIYKLVLTPEALQSIKFTNITGDISVTSSYTGPVTDFAEDANKLVTIKRSYSIDDIATSDFKQSSLVKITLKPEFAENAPDGYYEITDILPAGLRYVSIGNWFDRKWYPGERSGQKLVFGFYYNKSAYDKDDDIENKSITYYARAVTAGQFTSDHAFIKHSRSDISGFAEKVKVNIK